MKPSRFFGGKKPPVWKRADRKIFRGQIGLGALILGIWEFSSRLSVNSFWFSRPSLIFVRIWTMTFDGSIWYHLSATLNEILLGLIVGMAIGVTVGILIAYSGALQYWVSPYILALSSLPKVSLAPLFVIWLGLGLLSKVVMVVSMVVFVVFYNIYEGIKSMDPDLVDMMKVFKASPRKILRWVILPSLATWIINSLRISIGNATIGAVISEMIGASRGIGYYIAYSSGILDTTGAFAGLFIVMIVALVLGGIVTMAERAVVWR